MQTFRFELGELPPEAEALRAEVRAFTPMPIVTKATAMTIQP